jgi:bifunctional non-homologous end joining protein LigD
MTAIKTPQRKVEITKPDKDLFGGAGVAKQDLAQYYADVADAMLPHLKDRPISMERWPDGIYGQKFYQKKVPDYFPEWVTQVRVGVRGKGGSQRQVCVNNASTLVYIANQGCITPHCWLCREDKLDRPDRMIFDLDPPEEGDFASVRSGAKAIRELLDELGLPAWVQTTGSKGLHVIVPLRRSHEFDEVRQFARDVSELLARRNPDAFTTEQRKDKRKSRLFLDYLRNAYGQTAVPPYAVRAREGAPVACPVTWNEVSSSKLDPRKYSVKNVLQRISRKGDVWEKMADEKQSLARPRKRLDKMLKQ